MAKFRVAYALTGRQDRRELVVELASGNATARSVARAILGHEFLEVEAPFGPHEVRTAEQALSRFAISEVRWSVVD